MAGKPDAARLDAVPILLPLLPAPSAAPNAHSPPLHLLSQGKLAPSRIVFTQPEKQTKWISTNHVFPSAYPRSHPRSTIPPSEPYPYTEPQPLPADSNAAKTEEKRRRKVDLEELDRRQADPNLRLSSHFPPATREKAQEQAERYASLGAPQLWSTVQRIVPVRDRDGADASDDGESYTLLLTHANGFHKETWEPMLPHLIGALDRKQDSQGRRISIDEIWSLDTIGSGESGALNANTIGDTVSWFDGARDVLQLIHNYLPAVNKKSNTSASFGPRWLNGRLSYCRASDVSKDKKKGRKIIAVGHSFNGAALSILAGAEPDIFEALILIDPVMFHPENFSRFRGTEYENLDHPAASKAVVRRDVWPSQGEAASYFLSRPFWQAWNRQVVDLYARFAVRPIFPAVSPWQDAQPDPSQAIAWTLAMSKWSEAAYFATSALGAFGVASLKYGCFNGKIHHFVMTDSVQDKKDTQAISDALAQHGGKTETLQGDHLVVQQQPGLIGERTAQVVLSLLGQASKPSFPSARM